METDICARQGSRHGVVIPLFGPYPGDLDAQIRSYGLAGLVVVLVQNNPDAAMVAMPALQILADGESWLHIVINANRGGVAGGFNRGIEMAIAEGVDWITLLDQDSRLSAHDLVRLQEPWQHLSCQRMLVGPMIWDRHRDQLHGRRYDPKQNGYVQTRLLISSGTTFQARDWPDLGPMCEWLVVDFVDHLWCFRAQERGFTLMHHPDVLLRQEFGQVHPNPLCHYLGMQLYSPMRHFYSLRNLRWLLGRSYVPLDLKIKELVKMVVKPLLWLLCEPRKADNLRAIAKALLAPLPAAACTR